jgi:hypothetical protein
VLTIQTSSSTPAGTYQVTVVFSETVTSATPGWIVAPILLLPLFLLRKRLQSRGAWPVACLGLVLMAVAYGVGCGGSSAPSTTPTAHTVTSSAVVGLAIH